MRATDMGYLAAALVFLAAAGCAMNTLTYTDAAGRPVVVKQRAGGRSCIAVVYDEAEHKLSVAIQQDGESNWGLIREIPVIVWTAIKALMPAGLSGGPPAPGSVTDNRGCAGLFNGQEETGHGDPDELDTPTT